MVHGKLVTENLRVRLNQKKQQADEHVQLKRADVRPTAAFEVIHGELARSPQEGLHGARYGTVEIGKLGKCRADETPKPEIVAAEPLLTALRAELGGTRTAATGANRRVYGLFHD